jgi:quinol-cytochrome oxidoreductase complex cytochrome b subunit
VFDLSSIARRVYELLVDRAGLNKLPFRSVPYGYVSLEFWLGAIVASAFAWLAISGILLLLYYDYTNPAEANRRLLETKPFFRAILVSHRIAAEIMILGAIAHLLRNFLVGAYGKPREILWIVGVLAGFIALQTAFFGYAAIGDKIAVEAINIGIGFVSSSLGEYFGKVVAALAFDVSEATRYLRVIAIHVAFALILGLLFVLHFTLFEAHGIHLSPKESRWRREPHTVDEKRSDIAPWFPVNFAYILVIAFGVWGMIFTIGAILQALGWIHQLLYPLPVFEGAPEAEKARPMPPWFLVYAFKLFQLTFLYIPEGLRVPFLGELHGFSALFVLIASFGIPPLILASIPFIARGATLHPLDKGNLIATALLGLLLVYLAQLTVWGAMALSYHNVLTALTVFITPILVIIPGLLMLREAWEGPLTARMALTFFTSSMVAILLPFVIALGTGGLKSDVGLADAITGLLGVVFSGLYLALVAIASFREEETETMGGSGIRASQVVSNVPRLFIGVALAELYLIVLAAILLATIDPLANPILPSALIGLLLTSAYGLLHVTFRVITMDTRPYQGAGPELVPHSLVLLSLVVVILIAL